MAKLNNSSSTHQGYIRHFIPLELFIYTTGLTHPKPTGTRKTLFFVFSSTLYSLSLFVCFDMEENDQKELELLPSSHSAASASRVASDNSSLLRFRSSVSSSEGTPSLDLQLSISVRPMMRPGSDCAYKEERSSCVEALKWEAAEQIRVAAMEKAYAERVRELTRREMEMAQSEFARARQMWERAREEVERAERMKESATRQIDSTCMEITCQSCRQRFRP